MGNDQVEMLYNAYSDDVYRFLYAMCRHEQTAQDLLQTTFVRVMGGIAAFRGDCAVKTWIFTIARREYFRWREKTPLTVPLNEAVLPAEAEPDSGQREQAQTVLCYVRGLDEPHRTLMLLRLTGGLSFREIGMILGRTEVWARVTFMRDKRRLLEDLKEELS